MKIEKNDVYNQEIHLLKFKLKEANSIIKDLRRELFYTRKSLGSENERLTSIILDLQQINIELQSVNEELYTVNTDLQKRVDTIIQNNGTSNDNLDT